jgi:hypothetical protein
VLTIGAILLIGIFFVTSADSGALVMGMIATGGDAEPKRWIRVFFTLATAVLAVALLLAGGLSALQTAAITIALPFSVVMLLICWATVIAFRRERRVYERAERAQLVDYVGEHYGLDVETGNEQGVRMPRWWRARRHPRPDASTVGSPRHPARPAPRPPARPPRHPARTARDRARHAERSGDAAACRPHDLAVASGRVRRVRAAPGQARRTCFGRRTNSSSTSPASSTIAMPRMPQ